ncbi:MAG TPA: hypothetical protein VJ785_15925, partial [Anaerolineales bacterium]|nr:hypothetical protein [Anaerolineales bacterium]
DARANPKRSRIKIILVFVFVILILLLLYGAGFIALPISIMTSFRDENCDSVLALDRVYTGLYPAFMEAKSLSVPVMECKAYVLAGLSEQDGDWREAYEAYQAYSDAYPNGLYVEEAHQHSALALMNIIKDQAEQKKYDEAIANLSLIDSSYSDTDVSAEASSLLPLVYTSWGADLRESGDFERAEQVFNDFKTWSQNKQKPEAETSAQSELAKTYVAWGLALQSQKRYEDALARLDMAVSLDPASQAVEAKRDLYIEWGNDLLGQGEFPAAIEKFELAVSLADDQNGNDARDALANGYIQWASDLRADEDFLGALERLQVAKETAATDDMQQSVDTALGETYAAFSNSTGPQARQAMRDVLKRICEDEDVPDLPIFGLDKDSMRFGIYGVDDKLPENLAAKTPGEMHYIACIATENEVIESRHSRYIVQRVARGYFFVNIQQFRTRLLWNISLLKTDTAEKIAETTVKGGMPPPFPPEGTDAGTYYFGPPPLAELSEWLQSIVE